MFEESKKVAATTLTPEMKRKLIVRKADEAVGKANAVLRQLRKKAMEFNKVDIKPGNLARAKNEILARIDALETDREAILTWKKNELCKLRTEPLDTDHT